MTETGVSLCDAWIQRKLDTMLCSWTPGHSVLQGHEENMLREFLRIQRHDYPGAPICLLAEHFMEFELDASATENPRVWIKAEPDPITSLLQDVKEEEDEENDMNVSVPTDLDVVVETIYIHASTTDLLASQLFGCNADEPSQLVNYDDAATLAKFRALFERNPDNQRRTAVAKQFNSIESPEFPSHVRKWLIKVEWKLLALKWIFEKQHNAQSIIYKDPMQVFNTPDAISPPSTTGFSSWYGRINTFKFDHPWVVQEMEKLPKLNPKVWFVHCWKPCRIMTESEGSCWYRRTNWRMPCKCRERHL